MTSMFVSLPFIVALVVGCALQRKISSTDKTSKTGISGQVTDRAERGVAGASVYAKYQ